MSSEIGQGRLGAVREGGFTLVALMIILIVLNVAVATAMQLWTKVAQREQEEELIFRGLQYAEAIRVYQQRYQRAPTSLDELMKVRPRVLRQRWEDPLSDSGEWRTILAGSGSDVTQVAGGNAPGEAAGGGADPARRGGDGFGSQESEREDSGRSRRSRRRPGRSDESRSEGQSGSADDLSRAFDERAGSSFAADAEQSQLGPIEGVKPTAVGQAAKHFLGLGEYSSWEFRASMLAEPRVSPEGVPLTPRLDPSALGRPFPSWLMAAPGSSPHGGAEGEEASEWGSSDDF